MRHKLINIYLIKVFLLFGLFHFSIFAQNFKSTTLQPDKILDQHYLSLSIYSKYKLTTSSSDSLIWFSTDSSIVSVKYSIVSGKSNGVAKVIVRTSGDTFTDTCSVTVAPWISGITNLQPEPILPKLRLLAMRNDTLYLQGAGGKYGWSTLYRYTEGMDTPEQICDFPSEPTFPTDYEYLLPTSFGNFVLAKRESLNAQRKIFKLLQSEQNPKLVFDQFPPFPLSPNPSRLMQQGWDYDKSGNVYLGEYTDNDSMPYRVRIFKSSNFGETWNDLFVFPLSTISGDSGGIRHIHACQVDPYTGDIWIGTGDENWQSRIYYHTNKLLPDSTGMVNLKLVAIGSQEYRTVCFAFTDRFIYWFMDAPCNPQKIFRIERASDYPTLTRKPPNGSDYRQVVGVFPDKPFLNGITIRNGNTNTILIASRYEDAAHYGCNFRELDNLDRLFGIKENLDGSFQVQEIYNSPALKRNAELLPIGTDSKGYIYYNSTCGNHADRPQIYKAKFKWNDIDEIYASAFDSLVIFPNTKISLFGNFLNSMKVIAAHIDSISFPGKLPDSILSISPYYWNVLLHSDSFMNGRISVNISDLPGFSDDDLFVWLARIDPGDDWVNIGGILEGGNLLSAQVFSEFSEFAIGSYKLNTGIKNINSPPEFQLHQNYPNPFNNSTTISFDVPVSVSASVTVFDLLGRKIIELKERHLEPGRYNFPLDASNFASGIYFYRLEAVGINRPNKTFSKINKMVLMK